MKDLFKILFKNFYQFFITLDQTVNVLIGVIVNIVKILIYPIRKMKAEIYYADETMSSHSWRWYRDGKRLWCKICIDTILFFDKNHCEESYKSELERNQSPVEMRNVTNLQS